MFRADRLHVIRVYICACMVAAASASAVTPSGHSISAERQRIEITINRSTVERLRPPSLFRSMSRRSLVLRRYVIRYLC